MMTDAVPVVPNETFAVEAAVAPTQTIREVSAETGTVPETAWPPPISYYMEGRAGMGLDSPEPVVRSAEQARINLRAEEACSPVGDIIRNENFSGVQQCLWDRGYRTMIESPLPAGRTLSEQREINDRAVFRCGAGNTECQQEMGYIQLFRGPTPAEAAIEGNVIAAIAIVLGLLWLAAKVWAWLFASRTAYRYITKRPERD